IPLTQEIGDAIASYIKDGRPQTAEYVLFIRSRAPFRALANHCAISMIAAQAMHRAGVVCPSRGAAHVLRHSVASSMLRQGASLQEIADVLRHRSTATTEIYAKIDVVSLRQIAQNGAGSRNIRLAAIKSFMHYMEYRLPSALEQIQRILAIPAKKADTRLVRHLTAQEMPSILDAPDPTIRDGIRARAMLHLCFAGGLRVSELVGLRLEAMVLQPQANVLIHGKGRRERCLPLWKETASAI